MIYIYEVVTKSINKSTKFVKCNFKDHIICQRLLPFHKDCLSLAFKFLKSTVLWEQTFLQYDFFLTLQHISWDRILIVSILWYKLKLKNYQSLVNNI